MSHANGALVAFVMVQFVLTKFSFGVVEFGLRNGSQKGLETTIQAVLFVLSGRGEGRGRFGYMIVLFDCDIAVGKCRGRRQGGCGKERRRRGCIKVPHVGECTYAVSISPIL